MYLYERKKKRQVKDFLSERLIKSSNIVILPFEGPNISNYKFLLVFIFDLYFSFKKWHLSTRTQSNTCYTQTIH